MHLPGAAADLVTSLQSTEAESYRAEQRVRVLKPPVFCSAGKTEDWRPPVGWWGLETS